MSNQPSAAQPDGNSVVPPNLLGVFAVVKPWPKIQAAEDENIARIKNAAIDLGLECLEISPDGEILNRSGEYISRDNCDFVINLHFDKPKNYDVFSFVALWNPLRFYLDWGYERVSRHLLSHDDFLSCGSAWSDDHVKRMIKGRATHLEPKFKFYHSLSRPIHTPKPRSYRLFYAGINWERLGRGKSRHQELLDLLDKTGKLRIYGPEKFQGVQVWEGYESYCKQIPFDGISMVDEISNCGAALVLSSEAHKQSELMSNRLFESLAAGALIICDEHQFARKHFGDSLLYIDTRDPIDVQFAAVRDHLEWAEQNPQAAADLAKAAQNIFLEKFRIDLSLRTIYKGFHDRKAQLHNSNCPSTIRMPTVRVVCIINKFDATEIKNRIGSILSQLFKNVNLTIVLDGIDIDKVKKVLSEIEGLDNFDIFQVGRDQISRSSIGFVMQKCFDRGIDDDYVLFVPSHERLKSNHLDVLVGSAVRNPTKSILATASLLSHTFEGERHFDYYDKVEFSQTSKDHICLSRFLINVGTLRSDSHIALPYLDSFAVGALIQETISVELPATCTRDISSVDSSVYSFEQQYVVLAEYSPWLFEKSSITGYSIPAPLPKKEETFTPHSMSFNGLTNDNRVELLASLLDSTLPNFIIRPLFAIYDKLSGRK